MTAEDLLIKLLKDGVLLHMQGDRVVYRAGGRVLPAGLQAELKAQREQLRALVEAGVTLPLSRADWPPEAVMEFEERAGIVEYDGGMPRRQAEGAAELSARVWWARGVSGGEGAGGRG